MRMVMMMMVIDDGSDSLPFYWPIQHQWSQRRKHRQWALGVHAVTKKDHLYIVIIFFPEHDKGNKGIQMMLELFVPLIVLLWERREQRGNPGQMGDWSWEGGSVKKVSGPSAWGPAFQSQHLHRHPGVSAQVCHTSPGKAEQGGSLWWTSKLRASKRCCLKGGAPHSWGWHPRLSPGVSLCAHRHQHMHTWGLEEESQSTRG